MNTDPHYTERLETRIRELEAENQRLSEINSRAVLEAIPDMVFRLDKNGTYLDYKAAAGDLYYNKESLIGKRNQDITPYYFADLISQKIKETLTSGETQTFFYDLPDGNGIIRFYEARMVPVKGEEVVAIVRDITESEKVVKEYRQSDMKYRLLAENISDVIWILNLKDARFTYMSPSVFQLRGFMVEEALAHTIEETFSAASAKKLNQLIPVWLKEFLANPAENKYFTEELQLLRKKGGAIWVETSFQFKLNEAGETELLGVTRNIEKRKNDELKLKSYAFELAFSEKKFFSVFDLSPVIMVISEPDTNVILEVNRQFILTTGYPKERVIGMSLRNFFSFSNDSQQTAGASGHPAFEKRHEVETMLKSAGGEIYNCLSSADRIQLQDREVLLTSAVNITQLKKAEYRLLHLYSQQKLLAYITQLLFTTKNPEESLDHVLMLIGEQTGFSRVYIFEDNPDGLSTTNTHEWCNDGIEPQIESLTDLPYSIIPSWKRIIREEGRVFCEDIKTLPADLYDVLEPQKIKSILVYPLNVEGQFYGFIGFDECVKIKSWTNDETDFLWALSSIISNVFERHRVMKRLHDSELRLKLTIEAADVGLWDWNNQSGSVYFSDTWCRMIGYEPEEIVPHVSSWEKLVHPDDLDHVNEVMAKNLSGETEFYETVHRVKTKQGDWKWILDRGTVVLRDLRNQPLRTVGIHIDVSKQVQNEQHLKELMRTKDKLFSVIAHDLRSPVSNFIQILELLTGKMVINESRKQEYLEGLKKASINTLNLLDNLLNWSRCQTNSVQIVPVNFNLYDLVRDNVDLFMASAAYKSIEITMKLPRLLPVCADRDTIYIVIRNLLSNAIKFTRRQGKITITARSEADRVTIEIADNGIGISPEILQNIFEPGFYFSSYGTQNEKGSGIGLMLCKEFIAKNGGEIREESVPDKGSRFAFSLKPGVISEESAPEMRDYPEINPALLAGKKILFVEDELFNQYFVQTIFAQWNVESHTVENGQMAVDYLGKSGCDLILLDIEMPVLDGYATTEIIRGQLGLNTPIIAITANTGSEFVQRAADVGMNDYQVKPFEPEQLFFRILKALGIAYAVTRRSKPARTKKPATEGLLSNTGKLKKVLGDNPEQLKIMIGKFLDITPQYHTAILDGYASGDLRTVQAASHKLKSSMELIASASVAANIITIHEMSKKDENHEALLPHIEFFRTVYPALCIQLREELAQVPREH